MRASFLNLSATFPWIDSQQSHHFWALSLSESPSLSERTGHGPACHSRSSAEFKVNMDLALQVYQSESGRPAPRRLHLTRTSPPREPSFPSSTVPTAHQRYRDTGHHPAKCRMASEHERVDCSRMTVRRQFKVAYLCFGGVVQSASVRISACHRAKSHLPVAVNDETESPTTMVAAQRHWP